MIKHEMMQGRGLITGTTAALGWHRLAQRTRKAGTAKPSRSRKAGVCGIFSRPPKGSIDEGELRGARPGVFVFDWALEELALVAAGCCAKEMLNDVYRVGETHQKL